MSETPGGGMPFFYNRERMIDNMATYVNLDELPFSYGDSLNFENFTRLSLQPAYSRVPRNTLKRRTMKQYKEARAKLIEFFGSFNGRVCLTSDTWSSKQGEPYLCITVHWIGDDFILQKRIIVFDVMDEQHTGYNIYTRINNTLIEFNLSDKVFSISFDNATANTKAIDYVKQKMNLLLNGELVHVRCCAHIINLSAQEGISDISPLLIPIRTVVKWTRNNHGIRRKYIAMCNSANLRKKIFCLDTPTRWNSTHKFLKDALMYKDIITKLYNDAHSTVPGAVLIEPFIWDLASNVVELLQAYKNATDVFSYVYEPNVHLVIIQCVGIVLGMVQCQSNDILWEPVVKKMKDKWLNYFFEFPKIYGIACLLDPGVKSSGLKNILEFYYKNLNISNDVFDVQDYVDQCVSTLYGLYEIYAKDNGVGGESSSSMPPPKSRRFDNKLASIIFKRSTNVTSSTNATHAIQEYLSCHYETDMDDFNILNWWKDHSAQFPILSKIARDVLVVPASTVASESAFSAGRRVLDEKRSSLHPNSVKMCVCKKDWDQANIRNQGVQEYDEFEEDPFMTTDGSTTGGTTSAAEDGNDEDDD
ncbi:hypothetical protein RND81_03G181100 [Saponaria officinalis]|uniref:HAT C-terminal dimerisation domain-containing protein n=1 Tax=Saponaria officinalis TaxID=3572 RepID=A0AAW1M8R5_SAPOF